MRAAQGRSDSVAPASHRKAHRSRAKPEHVTSNVSGLAPSFPNPVNELAARVVAACVLVLAALAIALQLRWLSLVLVAGFVLRVTWGPRFDPFGLLATRVIAPRLGAARPVAGPPKRFAQAMGLAFSAAAALLLYAAGAATAGYAVLGALVAAALLESALGVCLGCAVFGVLMRVGIVPAEVCERCANVALGAPPAS